MRSGDARLTVLHWNLHSWRTPEGEPSGDAVTALVRDIAPDVVSLAEVNEPWGESRCLRTVAERTGYTWVFVPSFTFGGSVPEGGFGNALLVRDGLAVRGIQQWDLVWPDRVYDGTEASEQRSVLLADLDTGAGRVWVGATHMPRSDAGARATALKRLAALTVTLGDMWLICGDFNTPPASWVSGSMGLATAGPTYPVGSPGEVIDYAVAAPLLHVHAETIPSSASDHLPVRVEVCPAPEPGQRDRRSRLGGCAR